MRKRTNQQLDTNDQPARLRVLDSRSRSAEDVIPRVWGLTLRGVGRRPGRLHVPKLRETA